MLYATIETFYLYRIFRLQTATLLLALCLYGCEQKKAATKAIPQPDEAIPVKTAPILKGGLNRIIEATGLLFTEDESKLSFKIGGVIESVLVNEGDFVKKGQLLALLKNNEVAAQVSQIKLNVEKAERDYRRVYNLFMDSVATLEQLQNAQTGLDIAKQALKAADFNQQYARITAPADGFVVKKLMNTGEIAGPGSPVLVLNHVSAGSSWVLKAGITDAEWAEINPGDKAQVSLDAFPGKVFSASVSKKSLTADPVNGTFTVEIKVDMQGQKPATGMFGKAIVLTGKTNYTSVVPYSALLEADGNKGFVFVTRDSKSVVKKEVIIGKLHPDRVEITNGLENEKMVIVAGSAYLNEKSKIVITP
jgi:RND family efflux transporter MFP subunit